VPLYDKISIKVPSMGDSISEGTVVEWVAEVGQAVKADDVIALIETDKVTIDIKAQIDGVIVKHFAGVEEEVEVGADLYEIDTDAQATAPEGTKVSPDDTDATSVHQEEGAPAVTAVGNGNETDSDSNIDSETDSNSDEKVRVPSIQFLGKRGWMSKRSVQGSVAPVSDPVPSIPMKPHGAITLQNGDLPSSYGRLPFSEREIEDLTLGGAAEAPYDTYAN
jgi:2-oxoglutarate dehydrogenase E2 component (dihydrolipoamide succinyltransferase)